MGFRFRKSIKVFPGVRFNLSKSGVSASVGVPGLTTNIKPGRRSRTTVGVPGSGVSYTVTHDDSGLPVRSGSGLLSLILWGLIIFGIMAAVYVLA